MDSDTRHRGYRYRPGRHPVSDALISSIWIVACGWACAYYAIAGRPRKERTFRTWIYSCTILAIIGAGWGVAIGVMIR
jgi:hypothetical protein